MKRFLGLGLVVATLAMAIPQEASAWHHFKFGIGMNIDWSCGNNSWFHGAYVNGPNHGMYPGAGAMPYYGSPAPMFGAPAMPAPVAEPAPAAAPAAPQQANYRYYSPVQNAGYYVPSYGQAPSYWYGN